MRKMLLLVMVLFGLSFTAFGNINSPESKAAMYFKTNYGISASDYSEEMVFHADSEAEAEIIEKHMDALGYYLDTKYYSNGKIMMLFISLIREGAAG